MGKNWAITIGINGYRNLQRLNYAKRDAESVRDYFHQDLRFEQIYHFSDDSPPIPQDFGDALDSHPTFATLRRFLRVRFEEPFLRAGDNLWFFFAGHGVRYEDRDYLMAIDGDPGDVISTAISLHYVTERLRRCGADNVVLLIDACRSTSGRRDGVGVGEEKQQGVITLFSCSPRESSYEIEELQQGAFTHALLASLRLEGEGNCATVERLYHRLRHTVPELSQRYQKPRQTPYGFIEPPTKLHLILLPRQATLSDIQTLKMDAYRAETRQELAQAKQLWLRVLAVSGADSEAVEGIERLARVSATPIAPPPPVPQVPSVVPSRSGQTPPAAPPKPPTFTFDVITVDAQGRETSRKQRQAEYFTKELGKGVRLDMVSVPGGSFQMGSPKQEAERRDSESPQHLVKVAAFWMGKYPVTQSQWRVVAALPKVQHDLNPDPAKFKGNDRPVENVNWLEAVEFCDRLSAKTKQPYRLPSEAEWEYACRAGTITPFHFGETITPDLANYDGNYTYGSGPEGKYREQTTDVGSFPANALGLYDMHGNVWEWCLDQWHNNYEGAPIDGSPWIIDNDNHSHFRLIRGGSWVNYPWDCRSAFRIAYSPGYRDGIFGFRVVCRAPRTL